MLIHTTVQAGSVHVQIQGQQVSGALTPRILYFSLISVFLDFHLPVRGDSPATFQNGLVHKKL